MPDYLQGGQLTQVNAARKRKSLWSAEEVAQELGGAEVTPLPRALSRLFLPAVLLGWAIFTAWCVWGFPPPVDLPAHGAQLETLANLLRGDPAVSQVYEIRVPIGYGLVFWLFLPLTYLTNGAVAA